MSSLRVQEVVKVHGHLPAQVSAAGTGENNDSKHNLPARGNRRLPMQRGDHGASGGAMCFDHTREVRLSICVQRIKGLIE